MAPKEATKEKAPKDKAPKDKAPKEKKEKASKEEAEAAGEKQPPKPDDAMYEKQLEEIQAKISEKREKIKAIAEKIEKRNEGKEAYDQEKQTLHARANETKNRISDLFTKRQNLRNEEKEAKNAVRERSYALRQMERDVDNMSEEKIDAAIREIEFKMATATMPLKTEMKYMQEISRLKKKKPEAAKNAAQYEKMKEDNAASAVDPSKSAAEQIAELSAGIDELKEKNKQEWDAINALKDQRSKQLDGMSEFTASKKTLREECDKLVADKKEVIDAKRAAQKAYNEFDRKQRMDRQKKRDEEKARLNAEWEAETAKRELEKPNPYLDQTVLLTQTIDYCKILLGIYDNKKEEEEVKDLDHSGKPDGAMVLMKKSDRDVDMWHGATKKKALRKKAVKKAGNVKHSADTFATFSQLEIPAPVTYDDVKVTLEKLEEKMAYYNDKVEKWQADRIKKLEKAAAESVAAPAASEEPAAAKPAAAE